MTERSNWRRLAVAIIGSALSAVSFPLHAQEVSPVLTPTAPQDDSAIETEIMRLEVARIDALVKRDFTALERYMAPDSMHIESTGKMTNFTEFMDSYRTDGGGTFTTFAIDESLVRINGDIAVVTGTYHNRIRTRAGKLQPTKIARFTRVWIKRDGEWKMWSHQATAVTAAK